MDVWTLIGNAENDGVSTFTPTKNSLCRRFV